MMEEMEEKKRNGMVDSIPSKIQPNKSENNGMKNENLGNIPVNRIHHFEEVGFLYLKHIKALEKYELVFFLLKFD